MSAEFLVTALIVVLIPGTGVIFTLAMGLQRGFLAAVAAAFGCTLGIVPAVLVSIIGLSALLHTSSMAFQAIRILGVIYLLYMAWNIFRDDGALNLNATTAPAVYSRIALDAFLINILNPKLSLFFLAFLPQFVVADAHDTTAQLLELAAVFMLMTFAVFVVYGLLAASARERLLERPAAIRWIRRSFAGTFAFLGLKLAVTDR